MENTPVQLCDQQVDDSVNVTLCNEQLLMKDEADVNSENDNLEHQLSGAVTK